MDSTLTLHNGVQIPRVGLGVYQAPRGGGTWQAVWDAIDVGYRHIDTARIYGNEADVGRAIAESVVPREAIFVTTKLWNDDQGYEQALRAFEASRKRLGLEQIDLYLIHWPVPEARRESWRALETLLADGRVRAIGVSNYMTNHLDQLLGEAKVAPMVNQIEVTPFLQQREVRAMCARHHIAVEAYSPLTRGERIRDPRLVEVATRLKKTPAQVLLRWGLEHGLIVLPKSVRRARIEENYAVFDFTLDDAARKALDALEDGRVHNWDPRGKP